jgi:hypothetical protein
MAGASGNSVLENNSAYGSAWFVRKLIPVSSPTEEIEMLNTIDTRVEAVIDQARFEVIKTSFDISGTVQLLVKEPSYLKYEAVSSQEGFLVLSEIFYPEGWSARINGETAEIKRVNYVLRGIIIPPGQNTVELFFKPDVYYIGNKIMFWLSIVTYLIVIGFLIQEFRMRRKTPPLDPKS